MLCLQGFSCNRVIPLNGPPRGIANNNPGNIRISSTKWSGKVPIAQNTDKSFEQFTSMKYGVRALMLNLINYMNSKGLNTVTKIIKTYAPSSENDTGSYIKTLSKSSGFAPNAVLKPDKDTLIKLARGISAVENGPAYALKTADLEAGYGLIGSVGTATSSNKVPMGLIIGGSAVAAVVIGIVAYKHFNPKH